MNYRLALIFFYYEHNLRRYLANVPSFILLVYTSTHRLAKLCAKFIIYVIMYIYKIVGLERVSKSTAGGGMEAIVESFVIFVFRNFYYICEYVCTIIYYDISYIYTQMCFVTFLNETYAYSRVFI